MSVHEGCHSVGSVTSTCLRGDVSVDSLMLTFLTGVLLQWQILLEQVKVNILVL